MEDLREYLKFINNSEPEDPLLSATSLGEYMDLVPLKSINPDQLNNLTQALNVRELIPTEAGLARDFRGLAEVMGFSSREVDNIPPKNPTLWLIEKWVDNRQISNVNKEKRFVSLNDLLKKIEIIERFDVIDDFLPILIELGQKKQIEIENNSNQKEFANKKNQESQLYQQDLDKNFAENLNLRNSTEDDFIYDAFICYAPEDYELARELVSELEFYGKKIADVNDLPPGSFQYDALLNLIADCRKFIVICTKNLCKSEICVLQTKYASEKVNRGDILPILYEAVDDLPRILQMLTKINMRDYSQRDWQIKKLVTSLSHTVALGHQLKLDQLRLTKPALAHNTVKIPSITINGSASAACSSNTELGSNAITRKPIIDLMHSQESSDLNSSRIQNSIISQHQESLLNTSESPMRMRSSSSPTYVKTVASQDSPVSAHTSFRWLKNALKFNLGNSIETNVNISNSSRAFLLSSSNSAHSEESSQLSSTSSTNYQKPIQ